MEMLGSIEDVGGVLYGVGGTRGLREWETAQLGGLMALVGWAFYARGVGDGDGDDGGDGGDGDGDDGDGDDDGAVFGFGSQQPSDSATASACGGSAAAGVRA